MDKQKFMDEISVVIQGLQAVEDAFSERAYHSGLVQTLDDVILSAHTIMTSDPEFGRSLRMDKTILVAKGYQIKTYLHLMETHADKEELVRSMIETAKGDLAESNHYFKEIMDALDEWAYCAQRGCDFYTRPRVD